MSNREISSTVNRPDQRLILYWDDPARIKWWERHASWAVSAVLQDDVAVALAMKSQKHLTHKSVYWMSCDFDADCFNVEPDLIHLDDGYLPFRVKIGGNGGPEGPDQLASYAAAIAKVKEISDWLETDPVVDGKHISQHRWNEVANILRHKNARDHKAATAKMGDPAFTRTEAKAFIEAMRRKGDCMIYMKGRDGSDYEGRDVRVEADATWVKSTGFGGGTTTRVAFTEAGFIISKAKLLSNLQERYSASKNNHWKDKFK